MSAESNLIQRAQAVGVIPTLMIEDIAYSVPLARALSEGGLNVLEITLRSDAALGAIQQIRQELPKLWVGAGTVRDVTAAKAAHAAGAQFLVSPGYLAPIGAYCRSQQLPLLPGVSSASEIMAAMADGYQFLKCFPAAVLGGTEWLDAMRGPFPELMFCPTGGINAGAVESYLQRPNVLCVGGSWVAPQAAIRAADWPQITALANAARDTVQRIRPPRMQ